MIARSWSSSQTYRFGYGTQEKDDDIIQGLYTAEYWEYDSRSARRWNLDPVVKPYLSQYSTFRNNPMIYNDPKGDDDVFTNKKGKTTIIKTQDKFDRNFVNGKQVGENLEQGWGISTYGKVDGVRIIDLGKEWKRQYLYDNGRIVGLAAFKSGQDWMPSGKVDTEQAAIDFRLGIVDLEGDFEKSGFYQTFYSDFNPNEGHAPPGYYKDGNERGIYPDERSSGMNNDTGIPFDLFMYDQPSRVQWQPKNMVWRGNTSFLYKTSTGEIKNLITLKWGFVVKASVVTLSNVQVTSTPSQFHIDNQPKNGDVTPKQE